MSAAIERVSLDGRTWLRRGRWVFSCCQVSSPCEEHAGLDARMAMLTNEVAIRRLGGDRP